MPIFTEAKDYNSALSSECLALTRRCNGSSPNHSSLIVSSKPSSSGYDDSFARGQTNYRQTDDLNWQNISRETKPDLIDGDYVDIRLKDEVKQNGVNRKKPSWKASDARRRQNGIGQKGNQRFDRYFDDDEEDYDNEYFSRSNGNSVSPARGNDITRRDSVEDECSPPDDTQDFLGRCTQSAWLRWSHERRESFRKKVEFIEARQSELERVRVSSPIRKARKESVRFVAPDLEEQHLDSDLDVAGGLLQAGTQAAAFPFQIPPPADGRKKSMACEWASGSGIRGGDGKMSLMQWNALVAFWEHAVFVKSRYLGLFMSLSSLVICVIGLADDNWATFTCKYLSLSTRILVI